MFDMVLTFFLAFAVGLLIFFIYKRTFSGVMYSSSFGISLIGLTLITTFVLMANQYECGAFPGNGRFPLHCPISNGSKKNQWILYFLFWSIAAGIVLAAGLLILAVFGSAFIAVVPADLCRKKYNGQALYFSCTLQYGRGRAGSSFLCQKKM